jgi:hypothetical protein
MFFFNLKINEGDPRNQNEVFNEKSYKLAHATWECKYHLVWCPRYRQTQEFISMLSEKTLALIMALQYFCFDYTSLTSHR